MTLPAGDPCVYCGEDTAFDSGRFVNRIPADADCESGPYAEGTHRDGYACAECMSLECDSCGEPTFDYEIIDGRVVCEDCQPTDSESAV